jgi:hypothetical protein
MTTPVPEINRSPDKKLTYLFGEGLARVAAILNEVIDAIVHSFDGQTEPTEAIPQGEAASVRRLAVSILASNDKPAKRPEAK